MGNAMRNRRQPSGGGSAQDRSPTPNSRYPRHPGRTFSENSDVAVQAVATFNDSLASSSRMFKRNFLAPERVDAITLLTWNVAAVNNNPFEYWISYKDSLYLELMAGVEDLLEEPGDEDVEVGTVFTQEMFEELQALCSVAGVQGFEELESMFWAGGEVNLTKRKIITEFIKDRSLGDKRLISMPDRVTNTINVVTRQESDYRPPPVCRPSVINSYVGDLSTKEVWWERWKAFMFHEPLTVRTRKGVAIQRPVDMLQGIPGDKYPAITPDEERLAIPLQLLCLAVFDSIIVHLMNKLSPNCSWQVVKRNICLRLYSQKQQLTLDLLSDLYSEVQIVCLQEVALVFKDAYMTSALAQTHDLYLPAKLDSHRDQNSMILLKRDAFQCLAEVTDDIMTHFPPGAQPAGGDLHAIQARGLRDGKDYIIASFHGDTNGMLTSPLVHAAHHSVSELFPNHVLLLCLDANVYEDLESARKAGRKPWAEFLGELQALGLTTCWGDNPDVSQIRTTCSARTSLQPQLNKAVRSQDRHTKSDKNPKDVILFYRHQVGVVPSTDMGTNRQSNPMKDNTGRLVYFEDTVFPTLDFPSDHGIVAVAIQPVA